MALAKIALIEALAKLFNEGSLLRPAKQISRVSGGLSPNTVDITFVTLSNPPSKA